MAERDYTSRRMAIINSLVTQLKGINGTSPYRSNVNKRVFPRLKFWDEIKEFPSIHVSAGSETRQYQGGGYKDRFLNVTIRVYVNQTDAVLALEKLLEDVETVLEVNSRLSYVDHDRQTQYTQQITILSIDTDEGALEPLGVGEILCEVRY